MKHKVLTIFKIYLPLLLYLIISSTIYIIYLNNNLSINIYIEFIILVLFFFLLGLLYSNHFQKRGLIVGLIISFAHILLFKIIFLLTDINISFNLLKILITILSSMLGGILGIRFKKII